MAIFAQQPVENYQASLHESFPPGTKGVWTTPKENGTYSLINEDISLPAAVIYQEALENNIAWMQTFADNHNVAFCPHGKTSMTPYLFESQLKHGAWGLTVANPIQAEIAALSGAKNIIIANQLVGKANFVTLARLQNESQITIYCCVDSLENLNALSAYFSSQAKPLHVLIELGVPDGRCGERNTDKALKLAKAAHQLPGLVLCGIEFYEGVIGGENAAQQIENFVHDCAHFCQELANEKLIQSGKAIVTGAGSAWYDIVSAVFTQYPSLFPVIRPGCYVTHDTGIYQDAQGKVMDRLKMQNTDIPFSGDLKNALEIWAYVVSTPECGKAVIGLGKRDAAYDAGLPIAERGFRNGQPIEVKGLTATKVMDQHMFVNVPGNIELKVGDIVAFSTSHPCLTFDKWRYIALADNNYNVKNCLITCF